VQNKRWKLSTHLIILTQISTFDLIMLGSLPSKEEKNPLFQDKSLLKVNTYMLDIYFLDI